MGSVATTLSPSAWALRLCILAAMVPHNNPAGRLYDLLGRLRDTQNGTIAAVWAQILDVSEPTVRERLGSVAELVTQIDAAVDLPDMQAFVGPVNRYRNEWLEAIFPLQHPFSAAVGDVKPGELAYETLGTVAAHLGAVAPDGAVPSEEQQTELLAKLQGIIEEVTGDTDLPQEVAHLILRRLSDVEAALRHIDIGGPLAVQRATEALMGAVAAASVTNKKARAAKTLARVFATAGVIWTVFTGGAEVQPSIEAWEGYAHELNAGPAHVAQPAAHREAEAVDADGQAATDPDDSDEESDASP